MGRPSFDEAVELVKSAKWPEKTKAEVIANNCYLYPSKVAGLLERSGEHPARWDAVSFLAQRLLRAGEPMPGDLAGWVADVLEDIVKPKAEKRRARPGRPGQPRKALRDFQIGTAVEHLQHLGFNPTRNKPVEKPCAEGGSGCDVVGKVFGMKTYKAVEKVWNAYVKLPQKPE